MKIFGFEETTYPGLDASMGPEVKITNRFCDPKISVQAFNEHLELFVNAEKLGFDGAFVNEHHFSALNNAPDTNIMASAIIARTNRMKVGVIGNVISLRHPIAVAEAFAMLDNLSNGRFIPGVVRGVPAEWVSYNLDPFTARKRFTESYRIIQRALTEEVLDYDGDFWNVVQASIWPKPVQDPFPSFWMPAGSIESIRFAAENRLVACQTLQPTSVLKECFDEYRRLANEEFGWNPGFSKVTAARFMHIHEDHETALREGVDLFNYLLLSLGRPVVNTAPLPGFNTDTSYSHRRANADDVFSGGYASIAEEVQKGDQGENFRRKDEIAAEAAKLREGGLMLAGSPEFVADWLRQDAETTGYGNLLVSFRVGNASHAQSMNSQALFAAQVMPKLRGLNVDTAAEAEATRSKHVASGSAKREKAYFDNSNYVLSTNAIEFTGVSYSETNGKVSASWDMQVAPMSDDGSPTQIIIPGPDRDHIGCAIQVFAVDKDGQEIDGDAEVVFETAAPDGRDRHTIFQGKYEDFRRSPDHLVAAQKRAVAHNGYLMRLSILVPQGGKQPDLDAEESGFEVRGFKHLMTVTA